MNRLYTFTILALSAAIGLTSCGTSKNAQNGPDMYASGKTSGSDYIAAAPNDQYVQMKSQDYERWSYFDDYNAYDAYYAPSPAYGGGFGYGFGAPYYGFGYSPFNSGFGLGLGFGDPYLMWNSYFIWNSWYNPYFYNPYYGGGVVVMGKSAGAVYSSLRPFNTVGYHNGLAHYGTSNSRNVVYRPGMSSTTSYNSHVTTTRNPNTFRPVNPGGNGNGVRTYSAPTRSFTPATGGFRSGGFGGRH
jgi:hypothetical protein